MIRLYMVTCCVAFQSFHRDDWKLLAQIHFYSSEDFSDKAAADMDDMNLAEDMAEDMDITVNGMAVFLGFRAISWFPLEFPSYSSAIFLIQRNKSR